MNIPRDKTFPWVPCELDLGVWPSFLKTLTLQITFELLVLNLWYFTYIFPVRRPFRGYHYFFYHVTLTLEFDSFFENFNLDTNFWTVSAGALIFHMRFFLRQDLSVGINNFDLVTLEFDLFFFKTLSFRMTFEQWDLELWCFTWIPTMLTLEFDLLFENFNFVNNIWIVSAKALIFHMSIFSIGTFPWVPTFWPCNLDLGVWPTYWKL